VLQCVAVCCSVLQCVAVCCSVLQCVAVCCSVLQCVAVCYEWLSCMLSQKFAQTCAWVTSHTYESVVSQIYGWVTSHTYEYHEKIARIWNLEDSNFISFVIWAEVYSHLVKVAKTHRMPYLYGSFFAKEPCNCWLFCGKRPATYTVFHASLPPCICVLLFESQSWLLFVVGTLTVSGTAHTKVDWGRAPANVV